MEIKWEISPENPQFLIIFIDKEPWKEVYKSIFIRHLSGIRRVHSLEDLQVKFQLLEDQLSKGYSLKLIGLKGRTTQELKNKLAEKGFSERSIDLAISVCQRLGFLNDQEEYRGFVRRELRKGYGPNLIAMKLRAKHPDANIVELLAEAREAQEEAIQNVIRKKCKKITDKRKVMQTLQRRGFDWDIIKSLLY